MVDRALGWLTVVDTTATMARAASELQHTLHQQGDSLAARDAFIAGSALALDERLAVADNDFGVDGLTDVIEIDVM